MRKMTVEDLPRIIELENQLFPSSWSYDDFMYELTENVFSYNFVIEDHRIIGYVGLWIIYEQAQITTLGVDPLCQRQGYGRKMMEEMIAFAKEKGCQVMTLEVRVSNEPAFRLYQSLGFEKVAIRKNYYTDTHEDAYLMQKRLEGDS